MSVYRALEFWKLPSGFWACCGFDSSQVPQGHINTRMLRTMVSRNPVFLPWAFEAACKILVRMWPLGDPNNPRVLARTGLAPRGVEGPQLGFLISGHDHVRKPGHPP